MAHDVFVSYSNQDKPVGDAVCAALEARGVRCWIAPRDIVPGQEWGNAIVEAISAARVMVLVFSHNANASPHIKREVERAVHRGLVIVPFRIEAVLPEASLEYFLGTPHWLDAMTPPLEAHLERLAEVVSSFLGAAGASPPSPSLSPNKTSRAVARARRRGVPYALGGAVTAAVVAVAAVLLTQGGGGKDRALSGTTTHETAPTAPTTTAATTRTSPSAPTTGGGATTAPVTGGGSTSSAAGSAAVAGSWEAQAPLVDMTGWSLDLGANGHYRETISFASHGSAQWGPGVSATHPFAHLSGSISVMLQASNGESSQATFTPVGPGEVDAGAFTPYGFNDYVEQEYGFAMSGQSTPGKVVDDHAWAASAGIGGLQWSLAFTANGPGYAVSVAHTESGTWSATAGAIQLVPRSGAETELQYTTMSPTTMSVTTPGHEAIEFVRTR
jgi:hypothetical protein